jgi:hypothetical protein
MLVGVKASDPITYLAMALPLFAIGVIAYWIPGRRAAGLAPGGLKKRIAARLSMIAQFRFGTVHG